MRHHIANALLVFVACSAWAGGAAAGDSGNQIDAYLYLSAEGERNFDRSKNEVDQSEATPTADLLVSDSIGAFRGLVEYLFNDDEHELERLQVGWAPDDDWMIWAGRYHRPYSYWNTRFHHGQYLQTSIDRPALEEWEDDRGFLPSHATGLLLEWNGTDKAGGGLQIAVAAGAGPQFDNQLEPLDLLSPEKGHDLGGDLHIAYLPDALGEDQIGISFGATRIDSKESRLNDPPLSYIDQATASAYTDWQIRRWRLISALVYIRNELNSVGGTSTDQSFVAGYAQLQYEASDRWTLYTRRENRWGDRDNDYLKYFPESLSQASILGVRFDFFRHQALTFELARNHSPSDDYSQVRIQWSAVLQ